MGLLSSTTRRREHPTFTMTSVVVFIVASIVIPASLSQAWAPPRQIRAIWNRQLVMKPIPPGSVAVVGGYQHNGYSYSNSNTRLNVLAERPTDINSGGGNGFDNNASKPNRSTRRKQQQQQRRKKRSEHEDTGATNSISESDEHEFDFDEENLKLFFEHHKPLPQTPLDSSLIDEVSAYHDSKTNSDNQVTKGDSKKKRRKHKHKAQLEQEESERGFRIPQIHLPPRLVPRIGWEHHRQATSNFMHHHFRNEEDEEDDRIFHVAVDASVSDDVPTFIATHKKKNSKLVSSTQEWKRLEAHAHSEINRIHLRELMQDKERCDAMFAEHDGIYLDYSRQRANLKTLTLLQDLAKKQKLQERINDMFTGEKINFTEQRAVLHTALRADRDHEPIMVDGVNVIEEVHQVLDQVKEFTEGVRSGKLRGYTGKRLRNIISVGIGGSYLGPEFLHEVLKTEPEGINSNLGYTLRFLANVDPVDVERTCADLDPEETLIVVVSKTFTTAETMLNARTMRQWLWDFMGNNPDVVKKHFVACASVSATEHVQQFGIDTNNYFFRFWDWVGGRYSVCSAAGAVPISLLYGFDLYEKFLKGANSIDKHFISAPLEKNIPILMGLLGVWNMSFMKYKTRTALPYAEALLKLPAHIQQLDMESNGKVMTKHNIEVDYPVGEIDFGEPGTNGQHSFFQLLHMGQTCPCDFIGFCQSQHDLCLDDESMSSHDELMANFFAQPDALAYGKTADEVRAEGVEEELVPHRTFKGNRPSMSLLLPKLTAYATGQLLAIYEHRTAVQGFIWDINSFDQWGVELGKKLAIDVKERLIKARKLDAEEHKKNPIDAGNPASSRILNYYVSNSNDGACDSTNKDAVNPLTRVTRKTHSDHVRPPDRHDLGGYSGRL